MQIVSTIHTPCNHRRSCISWNLRVQTLLYVVVWSGESSRHRKSHVKGSSPKKSKLLSFNPHADAKSGEVSSYFLELHSESVLQHSPKQTILLNDNNNALSLVAEVKIWAYLKVVNNLESQGFWRLVPIFFSCLGECCKAVCSLNMGTTVSTCSIFTMSLQKRLQTEVVGEEKFYLLHAC